MITVPLIRAFLLFETQGSQNSGILFLEGGVKRQFDAFFCSVMVEDQFHTVWSSAFTPSVLSGSFSP